MSDDAGYVHDPSTTGDQGTLSTDDRDTGDVGPDGAERDGANGAVGPNHPEAVDREFGWRGWVLVGMIIVAFVIAPMVIYLFPPGAEGYWFALLIVPLAPAVALACTAIWATTRP